MSDSSSQKLNASATEIKTLAKEAAASTRDLVSSRSNLKENSMRSSSAESSSSVDSSLALKSLQDALSELSTTKSTLQNEVKSIREEISASQEVEARLSNSASTSPSPQVKEACEQVEQMRAEVSKLWVDLANSKQEAIQARDSLKRAEMANMVSSAVDDGEIKQFANEMNSLRSNRTSLLNEIQSIRDEIDTLKKSAQENAASNGALNAQRSEADATSKVMSLLVETHRSEIEAAKAEIATLQSMKQQIEKEKQEVSKQDHEMRSSLSNTQSLLQDALKKIEEKRIELNKIKETRNATFQQRDEIGTQVAAASSSSTSSNSALQGNMGGLTNLATQVSNQVSQIPTNITQPQTNVANSTTPKSAPVPQQSPPTQQTPPPAQANTGFDFPQTTTTNTQFPSSTDGFVEAGEDEFPETTPSSGFEEPVANGASGWAMVGETGGDNNAFPEEFPANNAFPDASSAFPSTTETTDSFGNFDSFGSSDAFQNTAGSDPFGPPDSGDAFSFS